MSIASRLFPRLRPSLPQNDSQAGQRQRRKQLQQHQQTYRWTDQLENVKGVPMAAEVPYADEPNLPWLLLVAETGLKIAENYLLVKLERTESGSAAESADAKALLAKVQARLGATKALMTSHADQARTDIAHEVVFAAKQVALQHAETFDEMLESFRQLVAEFEPDNRRDDGLVDYETLFKSLPLPAISSDFMDDGVFAHYRIAGPNPMLIRAVCALPPNLPLSDAQYRVVMGANDSLEAAITEHRLYLLDYRELDTLAAQPGQTDGATKYVYAPLALFALPKGGAAMVPVAIQCGQDPTRNPLFLPAAQGSPQWWGWQMAKTVVQVAECNYHELFVHLARTHLVMEAFAVATHRCLAEAHPLNVLLVPHFIGTLFINNAAATTLIAPGGPIDKTFGAPIARAQQAAGADRLAFNLQANLLPADLAARGVDNPATFPDYPYRDDALLVWQTIGDWVRDYVGVYYRDDAAVTGDTELADWSAELRGDGKLNGLPEIANRDTLAEVLTMAIFTATAQHAAVNFPQTPLMSYAPAIAGAGWQNAPSAESGHAHAEWLAMLPSRENALVQVNILTLLGSVYYRALGDYRSNSFPYLRWFEDPAIVREGGPLDSFQDALRIVQTTIENRNTARIPYTFLLPSGIPNSINI